MKILPIVSCIVLIHVGFIWKFSTFHQAKKLSDKIIVETVMLQQKPLAEKNIQEPPKQEVIKTNVPLPSMESKSLTEPKPSAPKAIPTSKLTKPEAKKPPSRGKITQANSSATSKATAQSTKDWQAQFINHLQQNLDFPEFGKVKVKIEILGDGKIKNVQILESQSEKNEQYLLSNLMLLKLPRWNANASASESFTITFFSKVD